MTTTENTAALNLLKMKFEEAKQRNPNWSLRAFAQKIGVGSGALSEILAGKRPISLKMRRRLIERLHLSPSEQQQILSEEVGSYVRGYQYTELDSDAFHMIADWWNFAILNLVKTVDFQPEISWISKRLGLSRDVIKEAWLRLFRLGYLHKSPKGKVTRRHPMMKTSNDVVNLSIRRAHLEDLKLIEHALLEVPVESREVSSVTLAFKQKDLPRAKEILRKFQDEFCDLIESDPPDEVYRLSIALFPLTVQSKETP